MAAQALEQSVLETKDKDQLLAISKALGVKVTARSKKADIISAILATTGGSSAGDATDQPTSSGAEKASTSGGDRSATSATEDAPAETTDDSTASAVQKTLPRLHRRRPPTKNRQPSGNWSSPQSPLKTLQRTGHRSVVVRIVMANSVMVNASNAMGNATDNAKTAREMQMGKAEIGVDAAVAKAADPMKARRAKIVTFSKMTTPR